MNTYNVRERRTIEGLSIEDVMSPRFKKETKRLEKFLKKAVSVSEKLTFYDFDVIYGFKEQQIKKETYPDEN